jgi:hypothetical protein
MLDMIPHLVVRFEIEWTWEEHDVPKFGLKKEVALEEAESFHLIDLDVAEQLAITHRLPPSPSKRTLVSRGLVDRRL